MKYPPEVQERIDFLNQYAESPDLEFFNILHMYPGGLGFENDGYWDCQVFNLIGFNTYSMTKRDLGKRDALFTEQVPVRTIQIFADGSTVITFTKLVRIPPGQAAFLEKSK